MVLLHSVGLDTCLDIREDAEQFDEHSHQMELEGELEFHDFYLGIGIEKRN